MPPPSSISQLPSPAQRAQILTLPQSQLPSVASLRDIPGLEIALHAESETLYLRSSEDLNLRLHSLDATLRARLAPNGSLIPEGKSVPVAHLPPNLDWHPLASALPVRLPPGSTGSPSFEKVPVRLIPSGKILPASLLLCPFLTFHQWGIHAPEVRLAPLRFAVSDTGDCIVQGSPLPPVPGTRYTVRENIACPLGFAWHPNIPPTSLRRSALARPGNLILFQSSAQPPVQLSSELFLPATRANLRATAEQL